jgi:hypothetical protein
MTDDYKVLMMDDLEDLNYHWLRALENIKAHKLRLPNIMTRMLIQVVPQGRISLKADLAN